jgi:hypothetical protein
MTFYTGYVIHGTRVGYFHETSNGTQSKVGSKFLMRTSLQDRSHLSSYGLRGARKRLGSPVFELEMDESGAEIGCCGYYRRSKRKLSPNSRELCRSNL